MPLKKKKSRDPEEIEFVTCEFCGHEQADMGNAIACEECGDGPMPTKGKY